MCLIVSVIIWSNCRILQFLHQMSNVFDLLQDDALLKICAVTEVVSFSVVAFIYLFIMNFVQSTQQKT